MKRKLLTFLLISCVLLIGLLGSRGQMSVVEAEEIVVNSELNDNVAEEYSETTAMTLYTKEAADHLLNAGLYRGYYHDRQSLGIYLKEGAVLNVRISNASEFGQTLELNLFADDSAIEKTYTIPKDGSWLSILVEDADYVPFIRTPQSTVRPIVNYYYTMENVEKVSTYCYGDDQETFLEEWGANNQKYAVIEGDTVTILIPRGDMNYLPGAVSASDSNIFGSIDELLDFYADVQAFYDEFVGLSYTAKDPADRNVKAKYFIKADKNGVGLAYYNSQQYVAQNSDTIRGYLGEDYWMSLHEFGHGYDGELAAGNLYLVEVANNILGHHYERTMKKEYLENSGNGWGYMQNMESIEGYYQGLLANGETFDSVDVSTRLYFMLNLLNKTDAKEMISELHHAWRVEESSSTTDFIIEHFSKTSGYDLIPYFERLGIYASENTKCQISEAGYPVLSELRNFVSSDQAAQQAMSKLNSDVAQGEKLVANGIYGLVSTEDLLTLNKTGNVTVTIEIDDLSAVQGKEIVVLDGEKVVASEIIKSDKVVFKNVPIGKYRLALPATDAYNYYADYTYAEVVDSANVECTAVYHKAESNLLKNDAQIQLLGIADWLIATVTTDIDAGNVTVQTRAIQPHWYFNDVYTSVKILAQDGVTEIYSKEYIGSENYQAEAETVAAPTGSIIKIYHREMDIRLKVASGIWGIYYDDYTKGFVPGAGEVKYIITENGLKRLDWSEETFEEKRENFYKESAELLDDMLTEENKENKNAYQKMKTALVSAISTLAEDVQSEFKVSYPYLFAEDQEEEIRQVARMSGKTRYETGYKVADALKEELGVSKYDAVVLATGKNFADALAGSYLAVQKNAPILLTNGKEDNIAQLHEYIKANVQTGGTVYILGGEAAVPAEVENVEGYDVVRLSGKTRYETNIAILEEAGVAGDEIIVATGKTFADSLSASAAKLPILLVKPDAALSDEAKEIAEGRSKFYIIGGEGAVGEDIADELSAYGEVVRVFGKTRYETSVAVANTFFADVDAAVVASGKNFPDGLCGGPLAATMNSPLILTADGKTDAAEAYMADGEIISGYVLGGIDALGDEAVVDIFALESVEEIVLR